MKEDEKKNLEEKATDEDTEKLEKINLNDYFLFDRDTLCIVDYVSIEAEYIDTYKKYFGSEPDESTLIEYKGNIGYFYGSTKEINKKIRKINKEIPNNIILRYVMEKKLNSHMVEFLDRYNDFLFESREKLVEMKSYLSKHPEIENGFKKRTESIKKDGE